MGHFQESPEGYLTYVFSQGNKLAEEPSYYIPSKPIADAIQRYWLDQGHPLAELARLCKMDWTRTKNILLMRNWDGRRGCWARSTKIRSSTADKVITAINPSLWYADEQLRKLTLYGKSSEQLLIEEIVEDEAAGVLVAA